MWPPTEEVTSVQLRGGGGIYSLIGLEDKVDESLKTSFYCGDSLNVENNMMLSKLYVLPPIPEILVFSIQGNTSPKNKIARNFVEWDQNHRLFWLRRNQGVKSPGLFA